ncbi:MAG: hypothetical protein LBV74_17185, partial [Tannerella sp.]|nr:hypothetical protein [Tannerella sp.]
TTADDKKSALSLYSNKKLRNMFIPEYFFEKRVVKIFHFKDWLRMIKNTYICSHNSLFIV